MIDAYALKWYHHKSINHRSNEWNNTRSDETSIRRSHMSDQLEIEIAFKMGDAIAGVK